MPSPDKDFAVDDHLRKLRTVEETTRATGTINQHRSVLTGLTAGQKGGGYGLVGAAAIHLASNPQVTLNVIAALMFLVFAANAVLRIYGLCLIAGRPRQETKNDQINAADTLPVYTILVPAYQEANVIGELIDSLSRLNYPRNKLDIKFLLEADDMQTIQSVRAACPDGGIDILIVPPSRPRTKPKALNYGLRYARGSYLVVFDAEDRPHPDQLLAALRTFADGGDQLAVVQSRLHPYNGADCWISSNFEWEYIRQFHVLMPTLVHLGWPMQLGGTSNHFRTSTLRGIGGWDSYNVTEDAEIGLYLFLRGCRASVINCPTMEEAPVSISVFVNQRTRWIKGHIQTWLVMMRRPAHFIATVGLGPFMGFQITFGCSILSPLAFIPGTLMLIMSVHQPISTGQIAYLFLLGSNIAMIVVEIGLCRTRNSGYGQRLIQLRLLPVYLCLQSVAAVRALWQMKTKPYVWSKTPHGLATVSPKLADT